MSERRQYAAQTSGAFRPNGLPLSIPIAVSIQIAADILAIAATGLLCWVICLAWKGAAGWDRYLSASVGISVTAAVTASLSRLYDFDVISRSGEHFGRLVTLVPKAFLLFLALAFSFAHADTALSRIWTFSFVAAATVVFLLERHGMSRLIYALGRKGRITRNLVIVGGGSEKDSLARFLAAQNLVPWVHVLGVFDDREVPRNPIPDYCPNLGKFADLVEYTQRHRVDDILVALPWQAGTRFNAVFTLLRQVPADIHLMPDAAAALWMERGKFVSYFGGAVLNVVRKPIDGWNYIVKWAEDKVIASLLCLLLLPVFLLVALAVKLDSPGPILFRQRRLGFHNQLIEVFKFRTLFHAARDEHAEQSCTRDDPRITRVGRILRRLSLDELPQLLNVLKGDMSLVGPRPHALRSKAAGKLFQDVVENYAERHKIKPGITGLAQVKGYRGETDTEEKIRRRVEYDLHYIDNWSLFSDLKIMVQTAYIVFFDQDSAY